MDGLIKLAIALGRLEHRVELLERGNSAGFSDFSIPAGEETAENEREPSPSELIQDGIKNIVGYTWPPRKDGEA